MTGLNAGEDFPGWVVFTWPVTADDLQPIL
jgi:hypothetical protein